MRIDVLKNRTGSLTKILLTAGMVLGVLTLLRIGSFVSSSKAMTMPEQTDPADTAAGEVKKALAQTRARADEIKKNNLFVLSATRQHPVNEVTGILGCEALIGDKWYKVGDNVGEARIVAIEPTKVRIAWNGQEKEFAPIGAPSASGGQPDRPNRLTVARANAGPGGPAQTVITGGRQKPGLPAAGLTPQEKENKRKQWTEAKRDQQQRLREQHRPKPGRKAG
jgi:hypothetical protein